MTDEKEILFEETNGIGFIKLNRPRALNALTMGMIREMSRQLAEWERDDTIRAVVVTGEGRAFCSGGDVKAAALDALARKEGRGNGDLIRDFFREEYTLNHQIYMYSKPYIAFADGIVMGGGMGISAHGTYRIVTDNTVFAMPETGIGFFPDVGGGYFLSRCPGETGLYLGLTGQKIKPTDCIYAGYATHFIPAEKRDEFLYALVSLDWGMAGKETEAIDSLLKSFVAEPADDSMIAPHRAEIDRIFAAGSVEGIIKALNEADSEWSVETVQQLYARSPTSLKVTHRHITQSRALEFPDIMTIEYRLSQSMTHNHDFYEGIRATLIEKDHDPKWNPARLDEIDADMVDRYFQSLGEDDLVFALQREVV